MDYLKGLFFIAILSSCSSLFTTKAWVRYENDSIYTKTVQDSYRRDNLYMHYFSFSSWIALRNKKPEKLNLSSDSAWTALTKAVDDLNLPISISNDPSIFQLEGEMMEHYAGTDFLKAFEGRLEDDKTYLIPFLEYSTRWDQEREAGAAAYTVFNTGRAGHSIYTRLQFALLKNDSLIYYSAFNHHDTIFRPIEENFRPDLKQCVLDSLTQLAMDEYMSRLK